MRPDAPRPQIVGPDSGPEPPFPLRLNGKVVKGFGRGSKELGIPTANIPIAGLSVGGHEDVQSGVYYGFAGLDVDEDGERIMTEEAETNHDEDTAKDIAETRSANGVGEDVNGASAKRVGSEEAKRERKGVVYPMVMSIGWNPFYKNTVRSVEVHILYTFPHDFYGAHMNLLILGFIRPEYDYVSRDALVQDIMTDVEVARRSLDREAYARCREDGYLWEFGGRERGDVGS